MTNSNADSDLDALMCAMPPESPRMPCISEFIEQQPASDYFKGTARGSYRRQLFINDKGYFEITNAYPVEREGSLRGLCGGYPAPASDFATQELAERWLYRAGWAVAGKDGYAYRNQSRAKRLERSGKVAVEVWLTPEQRDTFRRLAREAGVKRSELVARWLDQQTIFSPTRK